MIAEFQPAPVKPTISVGELDRIDVRVGEIVQVEDIEGSKQLLKLTVDFGDHRRSVLALCLEATLVGLLLYLRETQTEAETVG